MKLYVGSTKTKKKKKKGTLHVLFLEDQVGLRVRGVGVAGIFPNSVNKTNSALVNHQNELLELFVCHCNIAWLKRAT